MAWSDDDLIDSLRFGRLYRIKDIKNDICLTKRIRKRKEKIYEEDKFTPIRVYDVRVGQEPEINDLIYYCTSDKSSSLLKPD